MTDSLEVMNELKMLQETLDMRALALQFAFGLHDSSLYSAVIASDDQGILDSVDRLIASQRAGIAALAEHPMTESSEELEYVSDAYTGLASLMRLREQAIVCIGLKESGMILFPPSAMSTEEVMDTIRRLNGIKQEED